MKFSVAAEQLLERWRLPFFRVRRIIVSADFERRPVQVRTNGDHFVKYVVHLDFHRRGTPTRFLTDVPPA